MNISKREQQILSLVASEFTMKEIAETLFLSIHTVISHKKNMMKKLGAKNTAGLIRSGFDYGILHPKGAVRQKHFSSHHAQLNIVHRAI